jgi:hypothetical protein
MTGRYLAPEEVKVGWRKDFENAPMDGTVILVYRRDVDVFAAHYVSPADMGASDDDEPRWWTIYGEDLTRDMPTHWAPLPAPPQE